MASGLSYLGKHRNVGSDFFFTMFSSHSVNDILLWRFLSINWRKFFSSMWTVYFLALGRCTNVSTSRGLVISLGVSGVTQIPLSDDETLLSINRCHLAYADRDVTSGGLKQVQITGTNVGISREYQSLISPVLSATSTGSKVTPVVLGFALSSKGVKKSSAVTDRHGNFKLWVAPGLRRLTRLFGLLDAIETMAGVTSTTGNVPILQSKNIRDAED